MKVLAPVAFSPHCERAAGIGAAIVARAGGQLSLLHVNERVATDDTPNATAREASERHVRDDNEALAALAQRLTETFHLPQPIAVEALTGGVTTTILSRAIELGADLIAMGTSRKSDADRVLLGSVAERIARDAPCPVLVVHGLNGHEQHGIERALVGIDYSPFSKPAARVASDIVRRGGMLDFVHVWTPPDATDRRAVATARDYKTRSLRRFVNSLALDDVSTAVHVELGDVVTQLVTCAVDRGADALVVGNADGIATQLLRSAPLPLLVIPPPALTRLRRRRATGEVQLP